MSFECDDPDNRPNSTLNDSFPKSSTAALGRLETATLDSQRPRTDPGAGSLSPAICGRSSTDPDSGHFCGKVCCTPISRMARKPTMPAAAFPVLLSALARDS